MAVHRVLGWLLVLLGALAAGLVAWEWQRTGDAPWGPLAAVVALCLVALAWPATARRGVEAATPSFGAAHVCGDCGAPWTGFPRVSFCLRCGGTRTAGPAAY